MIIKEGLRNIKTFIFFSLGFFIIGGYFDFEFFYFLGVLFFIFTIFSFYFFRNPKRKIIIKENEILCPCDGKIIEIITEYNEILQQDCKVIRVFLSIFNVHVQRVPINGEIVKIEYKKGKFLPAMDKIAHIENEQNLVLFADTQDTYKKILCIQIAGLIARTIVMWKNIGEKVSIGDLYGMIKFGSQVDIYIPANVAIKVNQGQKIFGGLTILGNWDN
ncbi:MAG: phosphatidylserine decarboxylase [Elusimicrobiota bacterium]|jgi:phosphatidylserine decarboxylase|nr:phosphatidylserine decarboxylase [Elusimicrobiota bacterium]